MDQYLHVRVLLSIILGFGLAQLLSGVASLAESPKQSRPYWVHLVWTLFLFLYLIHFWWWEFRLRQITEWTFPLYFFIVLYVVLQYLLCTLLFPRQMTEFQGFADYFYSRKTWIFSLMALLFVADVQDTVLKGLPYLRTLGPIYYARTISYLGLSLAAIKISDRRFHAGFAVFATLSEIAFIVAFYFKIP